MAQEIKIAKLLTRTGLKSSLPQPLSPGEFGTALDTKEVFIGLNPTNTSANNALPIINCYASVVDAQTYANQLINTYLFQVNLTDPGIDDATINSANDDNVTAGFTRRYIKIAGRLYISYEYKYTASVLDVPVLPNTGLGTEALLSAATGMSFVNNTFDLSLLGTYTWQDTSAIASLMNFAFTPSSGLKSGLVNVEQNLRLLTESDIDVMMPDITPFGQELIAAPSSADALSILNIDSNGFNKNRPLGLTNFAKSPSKRFLFIGDSLTAGAGGTSPITFMQNTLRFYLGDGGYGYCSIGNTLPQYFKTGMTTLPLSPENYYSQFSPDFGGTFSDNFISTSLCTFGFSSNWDSVDLYYLKQPAGASFRVDHSDKTTSYRYIVDTNSTTTELGVLTITKEIGYNGILAVKHVSDGKLLLIGAIAKVNNNNAVVNIVAAGGRKASHFANANASFMQSFYQAMAPDVTFINLGMNDRLTSTPAQILTNIQTIVSMLPSTTSVVLVACNQSADYASSALPEYHILLREYAENNNFGFIDNSMAIGNYNSAMTDGYMLDGVHPNEKGNALIAAGYLAYMGFPYYAQLAPREAYDNGAPSGEYVYSGNLNQLNGLVLSNGVNTLIYKIGLAKAFLICLLTVTITGKSNTAVLKTQHQILIRNNTTTNNYATEILSTQSSEIFRYNRPTGPAITLGHTLTATIVNNLAEIKVICSGGDQHILADATYEVTELVEAGIPVFVN